MGKKKIVPICLLLLSMLVGCSSQIVSVPPQLQEPVAITPDTAQAYVGEFYNITYYNAQVVPYSQALAFAIDGVIAKVYCYPGMEVEVGTVLAELDQTGTQNRIAQLEAELEHMQMDNGYANALAQLEIQLLQSQLAQLTAQSGDAQEIALKENEIAQKQALLRQAQAMQELQAQEKRNELEQLRANFGDNTLRAPFSGRIVSAEALQVGKTVNAYEPVVFLADETKLHICAERIKQGNLDVADRVYAHIGALQYDVQLIPMDQDAYLAALLAGKTIYTEFEITGPEKQLTQLEAGQYAAICLITDYVPNALLVPAEAVWQDAQGSYVYVLENGVRVRRTVKAGKTTDSVTHILDGLQEGEVVYVP